jgi:CheY-like chemotaxis protein
MPQFASYAPHLPYLRRFARALIGSQSGGDAYAMAALEAIAAEVAPPFDRHAAKRHLFAVFLEIWCGVPLNSAADRDVPGRDGNGSAPAGTVAADRTLRTVTPMPRVAFLLHSLEGFSIADIAAILEVSEQEVDKLIESAGRELAETLSTSVLIIEDEPAIAMDLEALVTDLGHKVTRVSRTRREALAAIAETKPGLVLADIRLADGSSGLDAANDILRELSIPIIFITAYPEGLLTGRKPEPTYLIPKPFRPETVTAVISQALFFDRCAVPAPQPAGR